jgi:hypothetical protein
MLQLTSAFHKFERASPLILCLISILIFQNVLYVVGSAAAVSSFSFSGTILQVDGEHKEIIVSTSWWLAVDSVYGVQGSAGYNLMSAINSVGAEGVLIFYRPTTAPKSFTALVQTASYLHSHNLSVWIELGVETIPPAAGSVGDTQWIINTFGQSLDGIIYAGESGLIDEPYFVPSVSEPWLVAQKQLLGQNSLQCGFYQGDDFASGYGSSTDVNATYLQQQGLIPWGWILTNSGNWKLGPFVPHLTNFWVTYDILTSAEWGGPQGQSYDEIYNQWYLGNMGASKNLINNSACKVITWQIMNSNELPNSDALSGMVAVSQNWHSISVS